jgi:hypothetical protein
MKIDSYALAGALVLLVGCAQSQPQPGSVPQQVVAPMPAARSGMLAGTQNEDLLYVANGTVLDVYTYPEGSFVGALGGFRQASGECVDKKGDVFITDFSAAEIVEYEHGGASPVATLSDYGERPNDCSVDSRTNDLAVTNLTSGVAVYEYRSDGRYGLPKAYTDAHLDGFNYCGYDDLGNLFVDGSHDGGLGLAELLAGRKTLTNVKLEHQLGTWRPGAVQWDGKYLSISIGGIKRSDILRLSIRGKLGIVVGATTLDRAEQVEPFWIAGAMIVAPEANMVVGVWNYPKGGEPTVSLSVPFSVGGVTVSAGTKGTP